MKILLTPILALFAVAAATAQVVINAPGSPVTINFNGYTGQGFAPAPGAGQLNSNTWSTSGWSDGQVAFGGTGGFNTDFGRGTIAAGNLVTTGGIYSRDIGGGNPALWFQPGGTDFNPNGILKLKIQNNTGADMTALDLAYAIKYIDDQNRSSILNFAWSTDDVTYTPEASLNFSTGCAGTLTTNVQTANRTISLSGFTVPSGDFFYLRWNGADNGACAQGGSRDEYGLDDIIMTIPGVGVSSIDFSPISNAVAENAGNLPVSLSISAAADCSIDVSVIGGSAINGLDYTFTSPTTVTFTAGGPTTQSFNIPIIDDVDAEANESIQLLISNPTAGCAVGINDHFTGTINLNDVVPVTDIVITEIMYNSPEAGNDSLEFIEVYNNGQTTQNLLNCSFSLGVTFTFPDVLINPGEYKVVAVNASAFNNVFGFVPMQFTGALSNNGEPIRLVDAFGTIIDELTYDDQAPWPTQANGGGKSLTLCSPTANNALALSWFASTVATGQIINGAQIFASPGAGDPGIICYTNPEVSFVGTNATVNEAAGTVDVTLSLTGFTPNITTAQVAVGVASTATNGLDYTFTDPTPVSWPGLVTGNMTISIPIIADAISEGDEAIVLNIASVNNNGTITNDTYTIVISCNVGSNVVFVDANAGGLNDGTSWTNAYTDLQMALAAAVAGSEIWVAEGVYYPTAANDRNALFAMKPGVAIYGGFQNGTCLFADRNPSMYPTVLSGEIGLPGTADNSYRVVSAINVGDIAVLDGFTITAGEGLAAGAGIGVTANGLGMVSSPTISNCIFMGNHAPKGAGAYVLSQSGGHCGAAFVNCSFMGNNADLDGGGIFTVTQTAATNSMMLDGCTFDDNFAGARGGGIANWVQSNGVAIIGLDSVLFNGNEAVGNGAGMWNYAKQGGNLMLDVVECRFEGNITPQSGSAMFSYANGSASMSVDVSASQFVNNLNSNYGAVCNYADKTATMDGNIVGSWFSGNTAQLGGGFSQVALTGAEVSANLEQCRFENNSGRGGAIYSTASGTSSTADLIVSTSIFNGNSSSGNGGAMLLNTITGASQTCSLTNCTISGNTAASAGAAIANAVTATGLSSVLGMTNCIVWANTAGAATGRSLFTGGVGSIAATNCILDSMNCASNVSGTGNLTCVNNLNGNPMFVDAAAGNFHLMANSSAIDNGAAVALTADYEGNMMPYGNGYDIGAYEYQGARPMLRAIAPLASAKVFPNPNSGAFSVLFDAPVTGSVQVLDMSGRVVNTAMLNEVSSVDFNLGQVANGVYMVRVMNGSAVSTYKVVINQ